MRARVTVASQADVSAQTNVANAWVTRVDTESTAVKGFAQGEALAKKTREVDIATLDAAFAQLASSDYAAEMAALAASHPSPWADYNAGVAAAARDQVISLAAADLTRRMAEADAAMLEDIARAEAARLEAHALAVAERDQQVNRAAADRTRLISQADARAALTVSGVYDPPLLAPNAPSPLLTAGTGISALWSEFHQPGVRWGEGYSGYGPYYGYYGYGAPGFYGTGWGFGGYYGWAGSYGLGWGGYYGFGWGGYYGFGWGGYYGLGWGGYYGWGGFGYLGYYGYGFGALGWGWGGYGWGGYYGFGGYWGSEYGYGWGGWVWGWGGWYGGYDPSYSWSGNRALSSYALDPGAASNYYNNFGWGSGSFGNAYSAGSYLGRFLGEFGNSNNLSAANYFNSTAQRAPEFVPAANNQVDQYVDLEPPPDEPAAQAEQGESEILEDDPLADVLIDNGTSIVDNVGRSSVAGPLAGLLTGAALDLAGDNTIGRAILALAPLAAGMTAAYADNSEQQGVQSPLLDPGEQELRKRESILEVLKRAAISQPGSLVDPYKIRVNVLGGTAAEQKQIKDLLQAAAYASRDAKAEVGKLYKILSQDPSGNLFKAYYNLTDPKLINLILKINDYFATPLTRTTPAGYHHSGIIEWQELWMVVDTVDKIADAFRLHSPFTVVIKESKAPLTPGDEAGGKLATVVSPGVTANLLGMSGQINIYKGFWNLPLQRAAATLVHEMSHPYAETRDYKYVVGVAPLGKAPEYSAGDLRYAMLVGEPLDSWHAVRNADNYRGFYEQLYLDYLKFGFRAGGGPQE